MSVSPYLLYPLLLASAVILLVFLSSLVVWLSARSSIGSNIEDLAPAEVVIILGAGVYEDGRLTPILKDRVNTAIKIYREGYADKILMSGDNGSRYYNEVSPVQQYLLEAGVPPEDVFLDYAGFDTYDSMYRARVIFEVKSAVVVTQSFHLPRAVFLAKSMEMEVQGISPDTGKVAWSNHLRESLARVKALMDVIFKSTPVYLGERIPITGDGRESVGDQ